MGLFDFMKKKQSVQQKPSQKNFDLNDLNTDLPPVIGQELFQEPLGQDIQPPMQSQPQQFTSPSQQFSPQPFMEQSVPQQPQQFSASPSQPDIKTSTSKSSMIINIPSLDFIMPLSDEHESISDDLNKLFLSDTAWKEPDWNNFEPYSEPEIEHPTSNDFGVAAPNTDLPVFDEVTESASQQKPRSIIPIDVYVKGSDYAKVFAELVKITALIKVIDPKIEQANNTFSKEDILMKDVKEDMEYIYKKLMFIEKKIFADA